MTRVHLHLHEDLGLHGDKVVKAQEGDCWFELVLALRCIWITSVVDVGLHVAAGQR